jgi:hypothetical protein
MTSDDQLQRFFDFFCERTYLEYVNDYLTLEKMAQDKNMSINALKAMVDYGREIHNKN